MAGGFYPRLRWSPPRQLVSPSHGPKRKLRDGAPASAIRGKRRRVRASISRRRLLGLVAR
jgi:hypothetical protein